MNASFKSEENSATEYRVERRLRASYAFGSKLGDKTLPLLFDGGNGEFTAHTGILFQEVVQSIASLQIVAQHLERNASPSENGLAAEDIRILDNDTGHLDSRRRLGCSSEKWLLK